MTLWAGRILLLLGTMHLILTLGIAAGDIGGWFGGELWGLHFDAPSTQSFWASVGSFAIPQMLVGALAVSAARESRTLPAYTGWVLGGWGLLCALIIEPTPFITALIPAGLLIAAARAVAPRARTGQLG